MLTNHVSCHYVVTSVTFYHSAIVDLTRSRSVHAVEHDPCCPDPTKLSASECKAVHYGLCSPLLKLPSFSIPPATTSGPSSPATPKGSSSSPLNSSTPSSPISAKGNAPTIAELLGAAVPSIRNPATTVSPPILQRPTSPVSSSLISSQPSPTAVLNIMSTPSAVVSTPSAVSSPKMEIEMLDPVTLLAANLEDQLEALVSTFVAQDKVRLAARKKAEITSSGPAKSPSANKSISPIKKYDKKIKDDRSSDEDSPSSVSSETSQTSKSNGPSKRNVSKIIKGSNTIPEPTFNNVKKFPPEGLPDRTVSPFENRDYINKHPNSFTVPFEDNLYERSSSPSFKSSILPTLKPSAEYQQTGVKAQITKFASKEKDALQNSPNNSLERRQSPKSKMSAQEPFMPSSGQPISGPLTLDALQELLLNSADISSQPIQTTVFQSTRVPTVPYTGSTPLKHDTSHVPQTIESFGDHKDIYTTCYVNEACRELDENSPPSPKPSVNQERNYKSQPFTKPGQDYVQSAVDYAKSRIQNVQHANSKDDSKPRAVKNGHLVSDAKSKWESLPQQSWNEPHLVTEVDSSISDPLRDALQRGGHKRTLSMEGLLDVPSPSIPHPKLTTAQKQHIKERSLSPTDRHSHVPIRPFLTKGSVAERVLLFECCPDRALERTTSGNKSKPNLISTWRPGSSDVQNKTQTHHGGSGKDKDSIAPTSPRTSSLRRAVKSGKRDNTQIPRFYFPDGKPRSQPEVETHLKKVAAVFAGLNEGKASREEFGIITKACGLPLYWKLSLFLAARGDKKSSVSCEAFLEFWKRVVNSCHDEASKFIYIMSRGKRNYIISDDFFPMMQDVIDSHPGLTFLKEATEFHSRYIHTVIARIFYCVNRSWSGRITAPELRKSNFLQVLATLEEEEDINQITDYFSYEHFYVIYCKFWELDKDHDLFIDQNDLKLHSGGALSTRIIQRIFSGAVTRGPKQKEGKMSYAEFVWFLISEEDKRHPRSIEYWFRCMDFDGDGFLSMYELEYFYQEQLQRLEALGIETLPFTDCLCQMLDIIKPKVPGKIALADLKKCKMTPIFFDTFFNLEKYLDHEQRDPFASQREHDGEGPEMSDWDRFAAEEYELLVAEEGATEQQDELYVIDFV